MIIQAELKRKPSEYEGEPCAVATWILSNTVRTAWKNDCVMETEFGLLRRLDPPFPEQRQGQRMM